MATVERRSNPRYPVRRTVRYETGVSVEALVRPKASRWFEGRLCDISAGGVCLTTARRLKPSTIIRIEFPPSDPPPMPSALAEVQWVRPNGRRDAYRIGTAFLLSSSK
ncbi:MAG: PilZ domain-containing protein [Nitrospirae bacterium]|nr:PilZ domain-containing protein [Nitrospirota bacterium]